MTDLIDIVSLSRSGRFPARTLEFTAIDFETTGLHPGRVIEIAAVRIQADGTVLGEFSTLVNPGIGVDPGPEHVHRISRGQLDHAPAFSEVLGGFFELCRGSVLVAHNLPFEARFLAEELNRLGLRLPPLPGLCTLSASRAALRLPNYRLPTVAGSVGIGEYAAHTALADAQVCARVVSTLVMTHGMALNQALSFPVLPRFHRSARLAPRPEAASVGAGGWLANLVDRIPSTTINAPDGALEDAYLDLLADALADQHISTDEAHALATLAADAGMSRGDVRRVHQGFVTAMRSVAEGDGVVTADECRDLRQVAAALDVPELVADLRPSTAERPTATRVLVLGTTAEADELRAAVLKDGIQLAKKLTASVTHLAVGADVAPTEPRLGRAAELGAAVVSFSVARAALGLASPRTRPVRPTAVTPVPRIQPAPVPQPRVPARGPSLPRLWVGRGLMGLGLLLMFATVLAQFGGTSLGVAMFVGVLGVGALLGGWHLTERTPSPPPSDRLATGAGRR